MCRDDRCSNIDILHFDNSGMNCYGTLNKVQKAQPLIYCRTCVHSAEPKAGLVSRVGQVMSLGLLIDGPDGDSCTPSFFTGEPCKREE